MTNQISTYYRQILFQVYNVIVTVKKLDHQLFIIQLSSSPYNKYLTFLFDQYIIQNHPKTKTNLQAMPYPTYRVHKFALCYLTAMISYAAITTMMYSFYHRNNLANVALVDNILTYAGFGFSNVIVLHIIRKLNLKKAVMIGFSGLLFLNVTILFTIISVEEQLPILSELGLMYAVNIVASFLAGVSNSLIWTVMPTYIQAHCDDVLIRERTSNLNDNNNNDIEHKASITANMGLFWSISIWNSILGGILNIFVLGFGNKYLEMAIVTGISLLSIIMAMFFIEPFEVPKINQQSAKLSFAKAIKMQTTNLMKLLKNERQSNGFPNIFIYNFIAGLFLNFYPIFINKMIQKSLPIDIQVDRFSLLTAVVFIFYGVGSMLTGVAQHRIHFISLQNKQSSLFWGILFLQSVMWITVFTYNSYNHSGDAYWTCILVMLCWASTQTHIKTNTEAYIRQYNGGKVEYYSLTILFYSLGSIVNYLFLMVGDGNLQLLALMFSGTIVIAVWILREPQKQQLQLRERQLKINGLVGREANSCYNQHQNQKQNQQQKQKYNQYELMQSAQQ